MELRQVDWGQGFVDALNRAALAEPQPALDPGELERVAAAWNESVRQVYAIVHSRGFAHIVDDPLYEDFFD